MATELRSPNGNQFFDVLIDQIVNDVRQEFEHSNASASESASIGARPRPTDDLVARMIDFRSRLVPSPSVNTLPQAIHRMHSGNDRSPGTGNSRTQALASMMGQVLTSPLESIAASPGFKDAEAEVAFQVVAKFGARFFTKDFQFSGIVPDALKRERRRVLLTLHPDRHPEAERGKAHERFLSASDAFTTLAERAMATEDDQAA